MEIHKATIEDLTPLTALWQERRVILQQFDPRFSIPSPDEWAAQMQLYFSQADRIIYVAHNREQTLIGGIIGRIEEQHYGIVEDMALDAHTYHAGLGRALWQALKQWFTEQHTEHILVHSPRYYPVEQAFWRALGAKEWKDKAWKTPPERMWMTL